MLQSALSWAVQRQDKSDRSKRQWWGQIPAPSHTHTHTRVHREPKEEVKTLEEEIWVMQENEKEREE